MSLLKKYIFLFDETAHGNTESAKMLLGNKGAQLSEMISIGLPVPQGFTISAEACREFYSNSKRWPTGLKEQLMEKMHELEKITGKKFGSDSNPLLVSIRSGSYVSMPGMMDTILNLGLNDSTVLALSSQTKNERMAHDSYRRFMQMFGNVVLGMEHSEFEAILQKKKENINAEYDTELDASHLKEIVQEYKLLVKQKTGSEFPQDVFSQLELAISAVFNSWNNARAISYRRIHNLRSDAGTAVNVQSMVFGNMGNDSATGVAFTRNPANGAKEHYGEYLLNAQGEDVVAGIRTPKPIDEMGKELPQAYAELIKIFSILDSHYRDMQDFEFTIEKGKLYLLQTRSGKRTAHAAVKIAVDMVKEKLLTEKEALLRVKPEQLEHLLHKQLDEIAKKESELIAIGLPASPGAAVGMIVFSAERAVEFAKKEPHAKLILARPETSPEDIEGMNIAQGILTSTGGLTSHAAIVARSMGKCAVVGCNDIHINEKEKTLTAKTKNSGSLILKEFDCISLDGSTGQVFRGEIPLADPQVSGEFSTLMKWADAEKKLKVRANADTPHDAKIARSFGAEGIGLCRTEHMFFEGMRIKAMREMILAESSEERKKALAKLLPMQKQDFIGLFREMPGLPVTIRLLDPPLHEFLPKGEKEIAELAKEMNISLEKIRQKISSLHEFNPMLGFRGCRLGIVYPEITEMQVTAIIEAAVEVNKSGAQVLPEIEIPVLGILKEAENLKQLIKNTADALIKKSGAKIDYKIGTMIELPRACVIAEGLAKELDFFSFGTNDLTQTVLGFSRDDASKFIPLYIEKGILENDPFQVLDRKGVGKLMQHFIENVRKTNPNAEIGICGEHGGDAESVEFCHELGLDYVSCSPYRVPIARLAAAHAALKLRERAKMNKSEMSKDPLRYYSLKRLAEEGEDASKLFEF